jgi:hypothetical protein
MGDLTGMVVAVTFWVVVAAIVIVPVFLRYQDRGRLNETLRLAFEKGQPVPPELLTALQSNIAPRVPTTPERDLRLGVILIACGVGLCGLGYGLWFGLMSVSETGGIGVAYLILWATRRKGVDTKA